MSRHPKRKAPPMPHTIQTPADDAADATATADATVNDADPNPNTTTQTEQTEETAAMTDADTDTATVTDTAADLDSTEAAALKLESGLLAPGLAVSTPDPALKLEPAGQGDEDKPAPDPITAAREVLRAQLQAREEARKHEEAEREEARKREEEGRAAALAAERAAERAAAIAAMRPMYLADVIRALSQSLECEIVLSADATLATLPVTALLALADNDLDERIERDLFGDSDADADEETEDKPTTARKAGKRKAAKRNASASKPAEKSDRATIEAALIEIVESAGPDGYKVAEVMPHLAKRRLDYTKGRVGVLLRELVAAGKIDTVGNPPAGIRYVKAKASKRTKLQVAAGS